jgi:membrane protease YdiL (CAAX protease family)
VYDTLHEYKAQPSFAESTDHVIERSFDKGLTPVLLVSYPVYFVAVFFGVGLPEEIGWRGFALPRMQPRYGPLWGTLLLGVLWGFWHVLYFLTPDHGGGPGTGFAPFLMNFSIFLLMVIALAIIFTWVFNHTQGSIFISGLLHASIDTPQVVWVLLFLAVAETRLNLAGLIVFGVPAKRGQERQRARGTPGRSAGWQGRATSPCAHRERGPCRCQAWSDRRAFFHRIEDHL